MKYGRPPGTSPLHCSMVTRSWDIRERLRRRHKYRSARTRARLYIGHNFGLGRTIWILDAPLEFGIAEESAKWKRSKGGDLPYPVKSFTGIKGHGRNGHLLAATNLSYLKRVPKMKA